jgi:hypothetical protein
MVGNEVDRAPGVDYAVRPTTGSALTVRIPGCVADVAALDEITDQIQAFNQVVYLAADHLVVG